MKNTVPFSKHIKKIAILQQDCDAFAHIRRYWVCLTVALNSTVAVSFVIAVTYIVALNVTYEVAFIPTICSIVHIALQLVPNREDTHSILLYFLLFSSKV